MMKGMSGGLLILGLLLAAANALAQAPVYKLRVDGLACPFCAYGVEKTISGLEGVDRLEIDIDAGVISVTMAEGFELDEASAKNAVADAGFSLRDFEGPERR